MLTQARDFQDVLDLSRRWANDRKFQVGTQILRQTADIEESGRALSDIADTVIAAWPEPVLDELARTHGRVPGPGLAVLALGKLGSREMTVDLRPGPDLRLRGRPGGGGLRRRQAPGTSASTSAAWRSASSTR